MKILLTGDGGFRKISGKKKLKWLINEMKIKAIYENGVLKPLGKIDIEEKGEIEIKIANTVTKGIIKVRSKLAKEIAESDDLSVWGT